MSCRMSGAIPSLEQKLGNAESPAYPAAVVIQGTAMFTSDPIRCQTGEGKLLFRYWTNGRVLIQICAMGFNLDSGKIQCVEEVAKPNSLDDTTLAVFALGNSIREPFTLNIIPIWERDSQNTFLVIDEIAYIGECNTTVLNQLGHGQGGDISEEVEEEEEDLSSKEVISATIDPHSHIIYTPKSHTRRPSAAHKATSTSPRPSVVTSTAGPYPVPRLPSPPTYPRPLVPSLPIDPRQRPFTTTPQSSLISSSWKPGTRYPFLPTGPTLRPSKPKNSLGVSTIESIPLPKAITEVYPTSRPRGGVQGHGHTTVRGSFSIPYTTTPRYVTTTTPEPSIDYCKLLNCDFNDNACNYLNHGLTKVPWTLRSKGYGFPLSRHTDLRPTLSNGQFISSVLGPGDYSILESPRFNLTHGINVLLFQYYRPTHSSTIRLCMGTRYTKPLRTVNSFLQCPPILSI
uniref:MAM domain-containing protein n=1 Tax=Ditylenchus dipsaci TaxID=166011 RepID=A0A915DQG7_9BILA